MDRFEANPYVRLARLAASFIAFAVLVATAFQLYQQFKVRDQERLDAALVRLQTRYGGNTGKALAINTLIDLGRSVSHVDFSCRRIGGWNEAEGRCADPIVYEGLNLRMPDKDRSWLGLGRSRISAFLAPSASDPLVGADFTDARFDTLSVFSLLAQDLTFDRAVIRGLIADSDLQGSFRDARFEDVDLTGTALRGDISGMVIRDANVSGLGIDSPTPLPSDAFGENVFAWADWPPVRYERETPEGAANFRDGSFFDWTPLPEEILRRVVFCSPPTGAYPPPALADRARLTSANCDRLSFDDALAVIRRHYGVM